MVIHNPLVLHWHALFDDRDEDVPIHSSDQLQFCRDKENLQSQHVSSHAFFRPRRTAHSRCFQCTYTSLHLWSVQEGHPMPAVGEKGWKLSLICLFDLSNFSCNTWRPCSYHTVRRGNHLKYAAYIRSNNRRMDETWDRMTELVKTHQDHYVVDTKGLAQEYRVDEIVTFDYRISLLLGIQPRVSR